MTDREYQQMYDEVHKELVTSEMRKKLALLTEHAADPTIEELTADRDRLAAECERLKAENTRLMSIIGLSMSPGTADSLARLERMERMGFIARDSEVKLLSDDVLGQLEASADNIIRGGWLSNSRIDRELFGAWLKMTVGELRTRRASALTADLAKYRAVVAENDAEIERMRGMPNLLRERAEEKETFAFTDQGGRIGRDLCLGEAEGLRIAADALDTALTAQKGNDDE